MNSKTCSNCKEELFEGENHFRFIDTFNVLCMNCFEENTKFKVFPATVNSTTEWETFLIKNGMRK